MRDTLDIRIKQYASALYKVFRIQGLESVGICYKAGVAGMEEHWPLYENLLKKYAATHPNVRMVMYNGWFIEKMRVMYQHLERGGPM